MFPLTQSSKPINQCRSISPEKSCMRERRLQTEPLTFKRMNGTTVYLGDENVYFNKDLVNESGTRLYQKIARQSEAPVIKQVALEKDRNHEKIRPSRKKPARYQYTHSETGVVGRLVCIIVAVVAVLILIAAATLTLAALVMFHTPKSDSADLTSLQGKWFVQ